MFRQVVELVGVGVFAASGALAAGRKRLDWLGVLVLATVTAIGGGSLRDLMLGRLPLFWMTDASYLWAILVAVALTLVWTRVRRPPVAALLVADALGLAVFSVAGAQRAEPLGLPLLVVVLLGTITGVAGGMLRDVLCAEIPLILRPGQLYATASILGISVYLFAQRSGLRHELAAGLGMAVIASLRLAAIAWELRLPVYEVSDEAPDGARKPRAPR